MVQSYMMFVLFNVMLEVSSVTKKNQKITKCDNGTIIYDVGTTNVTLKPSIVTKKNY